MRVRGDPYISAADMFLLEHWQHDTDVLDDAQRQSIFADFVALDVDGQQHYKDLKEQRGSRASHLTPAERELLGRVRRPTERFTQNDNISWLRTCYEPSTDAAFAATASEVESKFGDREVLLNDPELYDFGDDWHRIFHRIPQLLEVWQTAAEYHERLQEELHPETESYISDDEYGEESETEADYELYYWAVVVGRIHIVDRIALASEGRNAGKVRIVFYDACGRVVRSYRETVDETLNITAVDNPYLFEQACWANGKVGKDYQWGAPLGPPYGTESGRDGSEDESVDEEE